MLNEKQMLVANTLNENILLLASAGTGKTNTLAERIKNILEKNMSEPSEILCVTFTNKACKEMKERIVKLVGEKGNEIVVKTFHGFCYEVIKNEAKKNTDIFTELTIYDEEDSLELISSFLEDGVSAKDIQIMIDFIRREIISENICNKNPKETYSLAVKSINNSTSKTEKFLSLYKNNGHSMLRILQDFGVKYTLEYVENLKSKGALDFQEIINMTYELFAQEKIASKYSKMFKFINIDEVQDTSIVEYNIVEKMFENNNVLLCGDNFQTIYEWRGSNPSAIFGAFKHNYKPIEVVFDCNYRATKVLTECSTDFLNNAFPNEVESLFENGLKSYSQEDGDKISFYAANSIEDECANIYSGILNLDPDERKKICILTRNNNYNVDISSIMRALSKKYTGSESLDFALIDDSRFFRKTEIKNVLAFLKLIANHADTLALKRILKNFSYNIGESRLLKVENTEHYKCGILLSDLIDMNAIENNDKFKILTDSLDNNNVIVFDVESTGTDTSRDEIIQIAAIKIDKEGNEISRFMKFLKTDKPVGSSEAVHGFSDEFLRENGEDKDKILLEFLDYIKDCVIVGHNVQYDINILQSELSRKGLPRAEFLTFYDTLDIYRRFYPSMVNHKLDTISEFVDTKHKPNHNALFDILATGEILIHAVNNNIIPTQEKRQELMKEIPSQFKHLSEDMNNLFKLAEKNHRPCDLIQTIVKSYDMIAKYGADSQQSKNLREFYFIAKMYDDLSLSSRDSLLDFVTISALSDGELEKMLVDSGKIPIITIHQAKGLEFNHVFLAGLQDFIFPNYFALKNNNLTEESRIMYVALTRAKKSLHLSYSQKYKNKYQRKSTLLDFINKRYLNT